mgnify:CR=1 FL=1
MDIREAKFTYEIYSAIYLEEVIDELQKELNLEKGVIMYFSFEEDDMFEEELDFKDLKEKALDRFAEDEYPALKFEDVQVAVDEDFIQILSKKELKLENIEIDKKIEE